MGNIIMLMILAVVPLPPGPPFVALQVQNKDFHEGLSHRRINVMRRICFIDMRNEQLATVLGETCDG